jgi:hypothetical protein
VPLTVTDDADFARMGPLESTFSRWDNRLGSFPLDASKGIRQNLEGSADR